MVPEKGKKYAIGYVGEFEYDGWSGVAEHTGEHDVESSDGEEVLLFEFKCDDVIGQFAALFPEDAILAEVK